ncbi:MAG: hypothetical protein F6J92_26880 [Symploca sp. SIO1A3]|nr:hypothetical protein [Symploca sp. SIO1A3]
MKIGMIFECGPDGADKSVCEHLVRMLNPDIEIAPSVTLGNKPNLLSECGIFAAQLLADGCDRIVIIWDLYPAWREKGQRPCRKEDCEMIKDSLLNKIFQENTGRPYVDRQHAKMIIPCPMKRYRQF